MERERIGFNFLNIKTGKPVVVKILEFKPYTNKKGETNNFFHAVETATGEEGQIYVDGGLKGQLSQAGGPEKMVGKTLEITHKGYTSAMINGETQEVNTYDVFLLKAH